MEGEVGQASHSHCSPASPLSVMILFPHSSPGFLVMVMGKLAAGSGMFHPDKLTSLHVDEEMSFQEASHLLEASQLLGSRVRPRRAGFRALPFSSLAVGAQRLQDGSTLEDVERDHLATQRRRHSSSRSEASQALSSGSSHGYPGYHMVTLTFVCLNLEPSLGEDKPGRGPLLR